MSVRERTSLREWLMLALRGAAMGVAEVVPGVSGGTIAFVTGIYFELLAALRGFHPGLLVTLFQQGPLAAFRAVGGWFLVVLAAGMGAAILSVAHLVEFLLQVQPIGVWAFFFGLIVASVPVIWSEVTATDPLSLVAAGTGLAVGMLIVMIEPVAVGGSLLWVFLGGAIAISAWVLPGVSGSFMLLLLGLYIPTLAAVRSLDLIYLGTLAAGCALGLLFFVQIVGVLVDRYRSIVLALLTGIMTGSLMRLWPWQYVVSYQIDGDGESHPVRQIPVLPQAYLELTGDDPAVLIACLCALAGIVAVVGLHRLGRT